MGRKKKYNSWSPTIEDIKRIVNEGPNDQEDIELVKLAKYCSNFVRMSFKAANGKAAELDAACYLGIFGALQKFASGELEPKNITSYCNRGGIIAGMDHIAKHCDDAREARDAKFGIVLGQYSENTGIVEGDIWESSEDMMDSVCDNVMAISKASRADRYKTDYEKYFTT